MSKISATTKEEGEFLIIEMLDFAATCFVYGFIGGGFYGYWKGKNDPIVQKSPLILEGKDPQFAQQAADKLKNVFQNEEQFSKLKQNIIRGKIFQHGFKTSLNMCVVGILFYCSDYLLSKFAAHDKYHFMGKHFQVLNHLEKYPYQPNTWRDDIQYKSIAGVATGTVVGLLLSFYNKSTILSNVSLAMALGGCLGSGFGATLHQGLEWKHELWQRKKESLDAQQDEKALQQSKDDIPVPNLSHMQQFANEFVKKELEALDVLSKQKFMESKQE